MTEHGILMYGLAGNFCEECGRAKVNRAWGYLTGCPACDEVVTRHRCMDLPPVTALAGGSRWTCKDCGSVWTVLMSTEACGDCCAECGHVVTVPRWEVTADHRTSGPRRDLRPYSRLRNFLHPPLFPVYEPTLTLEAEERDRREWIAGVAKRLGLVLMQEGQ